MVDAAGTGVGYEGDGFVVCGAVEGWNLGEEASGLEICVVCETGLIVGCCAERQRAALVEGGIVFVVDFDDSLSVDFLHALEFGFWGGCIAAADELGDVGEVGAGGNSAV